MREYPRSPLVPGDLHLVFDDTRNVCKAFQKMADGADELYRCEMRNATVNPGFGHWGHCPRGVFLLGTPSAPHTVPLGEWFTPLFDLEADGPMHRHGRAAIGIHGGGSGLPDPFAPRQGWVPTHGCLRVQNEDNARLASLVRAALKCGRRAYITVGGEAG